MAKSKFSIHWHLLLTRAHITQSMWQNMSLYTVITWCDGSVCLLAMNRGQYRNDINNSVTYITIVHSLWVVKGGRYSVYFRLWSHLCETWCNRLARLSDSRFEFEHVFISIISSSEIWTFAFGQSINLFRQPGGSVINTPSIFCFMLVSFRTFKISWSTCFSNIFAKPVFMADTLLILALPYFRSFWLFPMSMLSLSPNFWSCSRASQYLGQPFTPRLLKNAPKDSCMTFAVHGMWFLNAGHSIPESSRVACSSRVIELSGEALLVQIGSKRPSVSSNRLKTFLKCAASIAPVWLPSTCHPELASETGKEQTINHIGTELYFMQCTISQYIVSNAWWQGEFISWCPSVQS